MLTFPLIYGVYASELMDIYELSSEGSINLEIASYLSNCESNFTVEKTFSTSEPELSR